MSDKSREEFEEICDSLPVKITNNEKAVAQYIWTTQQKKIDALEAENPQVDCPECNNHENEQMICFFCREKGKVPLTKAQEYRIKELEQQRDELIDALYEYAEVCIPDSGYTLMDVYDPLSTGCITCPQEDRACKFLRDQIMAGKR